MSGGLLEKAKQVSGDDDEDVDAAAEAVLEIAPGSFESSGGGWIGSMASQGNNVMYIAGALLALSLGLILVMGSMDIDFMGWGVLLLLILSGYLASVHVKYGRNAGGTVSPLQWSAIAVVWLLLSGGTWVVGWDDEGGSILLTDGEVHDDSDTVTLMLRHSSGLFSSSWDGGDVGVSVTQDGAETWSGTINVMMNQEDMIGAYGVLTLLISDFYSASAIQVDGFTEIGLVNTVEHPYTVTVTLDGESSSEVLPTLPLSRNVDDVDEEAHGQVGDNGCDSGYTSCVEYVEIRGWVGIGVEGGDEDSTPVRVRGDYTLSMSFGIDDDNSIDQKPVTVSGTDASWAAGDCGAGSMEIAVDTSGFMFKCNAATNFDADIALSDSSDEREYGCYTLTLTASQDGEDVATSSSDYMFEHHQDTSEGNTYQWETFESSDENGDPISC